MSEHNGDLRSAALHYAELGYLVFPCVPGDKKPLTPHGFRDATNNRETIEMWWREYPQANIGISTSRLLVVDVDGADNIWPDDIDRFQELEQSPMSRTPQGGRHHIYRQPVGKRWRNTASQLSAKVDTRAKGGYIVVPPSRVDGKSYEWISVLDVEPEGLPEPPEWLIDALDNTDNKDLAELSENTDGNIIPDGQRNATLTRLAGAMRRVGMGGDEIVAALLQTNQHRCQPPLEDDEVGRIVASVCRYEPDQVSVAVVENHYAQTVEAESDETNDLPSDPGPIPDELLRVPGFVSELMDYCLETAPCPNRVLAFAGASAMQAFLAGRKVRDPGDNRTNIYLLGLAHSAAGKDHPRKTNMRIAHEIGLEKRIGDRFASGEGIQDALFTNPCLLYQSDEINGIFLSINKAKDARYESIVDTLLSLYSSSSSVVPMRHKAGKDSPGSIDQPCLVIFGTAIPNHYYEALSDRMLTNGLLARMIVLESPKRSKGQEPSIRPLPDRVLVAAKWWSSFRPGRGNLDVWYPDPAIVEHTDGARRVLIETREEAEEEYSRSEDDADMVGTTVWGRVNEHSRKLALLYAISANYEKPSIDEDAALWASRFAMHQARRMLFMAQSHVADSPFHADCLQVIRKLRAAPNRTLSHSILLKRMKKDAKAFKKIVQTLAQQSDIEIIEIKTQGRTGYEYRLLKGE